MMDADLHVDVVVGSLDVVDGVGHEGDKVLHVVADFLQEQLSRKQVGQT